MEVRPLTPDCVADLAALFEEGGDPKWCWCQSQVGITPCDKDRCDGKLLMDPLARRG